MRNMRLFDKIKLSKETSKEICFSSNEIEFVKSYKQGPGGGSYVVDFKLELKPTTDKVIEVYYLPSEETNECMPHIFKGVQRFVEGLYTENISIKGFKLEISNCVVHPVDFQPLRYEIFVMIALNRLSFYKGIKTVKDSEINLPIIQSKSLNKFLHSSEDYPSDYSNYIIKRLHLPNRGFNSKSLLNNYDLQRSFEEKFVDIKIFQNSSIRHDNYISIYTLNDISSINIFNSVIEEVIMYKTDIYSKNKDITGFDIFIGRSDLDYGTKQLGKYLYWNLLNLIR